MPRLAYAARTLLAQVGGDTSCIIGDPDGFGVHRNVMVSVRHQAQVDRDPRVQRTMAVESDLGRVLLVEIVSGRAGDLAHDFDLG